MNESHAVQATSTATMIRIHRSPRLNTFLWPEGSRGDWYGFGSSLMPPFYSAG